MIDQRQGGAAAIALASRCGHCSLLLLPQLVQPRARSAFALAQAPPALWGSAGAIVLQAAPSVT